MHCPDGTSDGGVTMGIKTNMTAKQISFIFKELQKSSDLPMGRRASYLWSLVKAMLFRLILDKVYT